MVFYVFFSKKRKGIVPPKRLTDNDRKGDDRMGQEYQCKNGQLIVEMPKEIDHHCAKELREDIDRMIEISHVKTLVFDFSRTEFMDSSGIGVLIGRCRNLGYTGGSVQAVHLNERVKKIFMVSGLSKLIPMGAAQEKAGGRFDGE